VHTSITTGTITTLLSALLIAGCTTDRASHSDHAAPSHPAAASTPPSDALELGNFSVSLAVKDIAASRAFYEALGLRVIAGDQAQNWLILQNQTATIGLFQGMFERNTLTFNPGWDRSMTTLTTFDDIRDIQAALRSKGLTPTLAAEESSTGPASLMLIDPDGNPILIDQHVSRPGE